MTHPFAHPLTVALFTGLMQLRESAEDIMVTPEADSVEVDAAIATATTSEAATHPSTKEIPSQAPKKEK